MINKNSLKIEKLNFNNQMYSAFFKKTVPLPHFDLNKWSQISKILHLFSETPFKTHTSFQDQLLLLYNISLNCPLKSFNNLGHFFDENPVIATNFLVLTLPYIANLALELPKLFPKPINFLLQDQETSQTFTKKQIACLLVHMFFGTITKQDQNPNFQNLLNFQRFLTQKNEVLYEKLHCLFNYFTRLQSNLIDFSLNVSYVRLKKDLKTMQDWQKSKRNLLDVMILDEGGIEDFYPNTIQVDFANSFIGGGALLECCVQEEIRFIISPECFPSMILFECFQDFEVGYIIGAEQFCKYKGYGMNFAYDGDFRDLQPKFDGKHRMDVNILALDAICFYGEGQFEEGFLLRELNKAFIGNIFHL